MSGKTTQIVLRPYALVLGKAICPADPIAGLARATAEAGQSEIDRVAALLEGLKTRQDLLEFLAASWANGQPIAASIGALRSLGPASDVPLLAAAARLLADVGDGRLSVQRMNLIPPGLRSLAGLPSPRELKDGD